MVPQDRRQDKFHFDRTINLSSLVGFLLLLGTIIHFGSGILESVREANGKINIMWSDFVITRPQYRYLYPGP